MLFVQKGDFLPKSALAIFQFMKRIKGSAHLYDNSKFLQQCFFILFVFKGTVLYNSLVPVVNLELQTLNCAVDSKVRRD